MKRNKFQAIMLLFAMSCAWHCAHTSTGAETAGTKSSVSPVCIRGVEISENKLQQIQPGKTTVSELKQIFGPPQTTMDTVNTGNYYDEKCGEKDARISSIGYTCFLQTGVDTVTFLINDDIVCNVNRIRNVQ